MKRAMFLLPVALTAALAAALMPAAPGSPSLGYAAPVSAAHPVATDSRARTTWDDFSGGFDHTGDDAKWALTPLGPFPNGDGKASTSSAGLRVVPTGTNPRTGAPAFAYTTGKESDGGDGGLDHVKWYALANHRASSGVLGFDADPGSVLTFDSTFSARTYGTGQHPFGDAVADPRNDLRLASGAMTTIDQESNMVFDFFVTNEWVYAFYERLPTPGADHVAFSYALPVERRSHPGQVNDLAISYDRSAGTVVWKVDGREVYKVDKIGFRPKDRTHLIIDLGGREELVAPRQLAPGFGMFVLLDADAPHLGTDRDGGPRADGALVKLTDTTSYYDPDAGAPVPQTFVDPDSRPGNRLWGQGARLDVRQLSITGARY
ncbi:DUF6081 family protein [Streptomyces sp. NPDC006274]|uniref:DUF6081 family protein n=1 Tax=unclassified Streptomyces TaxID=2593676 RepID=UPI0033A8302C